MSDLESGFHTIILRAAVSLDRHSLYFSADISGEEYRGMVISICYDSSNPEGSTTASLKALENGDLGPFYT